ncbi:glycosyltransferase family 2 protein [Streptococcus phocae subsp. salmonis]|uniref:glycosyltransferase family 2 protein n=1 Tax=Streptococcus phocae TaxID=119224 RepID=UPI000530DFCD|nr:glycosyltransferase family 2 protein [Streptococcus phocae]KGR73085.1 glycosyl transferase [Streptococcus phocae subsp. salmonis]
MENKITTIHTFVICAYGESPYLEECIVSLKNQEYASQLLLYTSTPNDLIKGLATKYQIQLVTKEGGGIGRDWNNALSFVTTPYATIAHQDDIYLPTYSKEIITKFINNKDATIVFSNYAEHRNGSVVETNFNLKIKNILLKTLNLFPKSKFWRQRMLSFGNPISCPAVSYHLAKLKDFRFSEDWRTNLDWYAWYIISNQYQGSFHYIEKILMYHRIHEDSETSNTIRENIRTKEDLAMFKLFWPSWIVPMLGYFYIKSQDSNTVEKETK